MKTLYFEGAGWATCGEVSNCRIRTAFTNTKGNKVYIELMGREVTKENIKNEYYQSGWHKRYQNYRPGDGFGFCDFCYVITNNPKIDDCNANRVRDQKGEVVERCNDFAYTYKGILEFVNKYCNTDFDEIVILPSLAGYRVFNDKGKHDTYSGYNYGDKFKYKPRLTARRIKKANELSEHYKELFHLRYDNTSFYVEDNKLMVRLNVSDESLREAGITERLMTVEV